MIKRVGQDMVSLNRCWREELITVSYSCCVNRLNPETLTAHPLIQPTSLWQHCYIRVVQLIPLLFNPP